MCVAEEIAGGASGNDARLAGQRFERGWIEMVHVGVREQDEIDGGQLTRLERGCDQTFGADVSEKGVGANAFAEDRVRENGQAEEIQKDGGVAEPGCGDGVGIPGVRRGSGSWFQDGSASFFNEAADGASGHLIGETCPKAGTAQGGDG